MGIGKDGHIAFDFPGDVLHATTHIERLPDSIFSSKKGLFGGDNEVPVAAVTIGMNVVLHARKIILMVNDSSKKAAVQMLLERSEVTPRLPASILWLHNDVTLIMTRESCPFALRK